MKPQKKYILEKAKTQSAPVTELKTVIENASLMEGNLKQYLEACKKILGDDRIGVRVKTTGKGDEKETVKYDCVETVKHTLKDVMSILTTDENDKKNVNLSVKDEEKLINMKPSRQLVVLNATLRRKGINIKAVSHKRDEFVVQYGLPQEAF